MLTDRLSVVILIGRSPPEEGLTDEALEKLLENSNKIDTNYGHFFDHVLVNEDINKTYEDLKVTAPRARVSLLCVA